MFDHLRQPVRAPSGVLFIILAVRTQRALRLAYVWRLTVGCTLGLMSTTVPAWTILDRTWFVLLRHQHLPCPPPRRPVGGDDAMSLPIFAAALASGAVSTKRVALVTGANKGIGKEIARLLGALPDHAVVLGCRNEQLGMAVAAELQVQLVNQGRHALHVGLPLTDTTLSHTALSRHRRKGATPPTAGWT